MPDSFSFSTTIICVSLNRLRMQAEAQAAQAEGVVGVDIHEGSHVWKSHVIEFFAIGTAVVPLEWEIAPSLLADPMLVLSVND